MPYFLFKKHYYFIQVADSISTFILHAYVLFISNTYFCCVLLDTLSLANQLNLVRKVLSQK